MAHYPYLVIEVDDVKESMKKVAEAGGKVLPGEPAEIPGVRFELLFSLISFMHGQTER